MDLIPPEAMIAMGEVLTIGADKYGDRNWEENLGDAEAGLTFDRFVGAMLRHLTAYQRGELVDPESGFSHLKHVLWNAMAMVTEEERRADLSSG